MMARRSLWCAIVMALVLASALPPAAALPRLALVAFGLSRAWFYWCSMLLGAAPYLTAGGLAAATARRWLRSSTRVAGDCKVAHWRRLALPAFAVLFPGCDCTMNAFAAAMRCAPEWIAAFAIVWGSCCNPLALLSTAAILGPRMLEIRLGAGFVAAILTAVAWSRLPAQAAPAACTATHKFSEDFMRSTAAGIASFSIAAAVSSMCLVFLSRAAAGFTGPPLAALAGAVLSPCSTADALLARVLFHAPASQIAFIIAAQCLDVRQIVLLHRSFGAARTVRAVAAAALACVLGCFLAAR